MTKRVVHLSTVHPALDNRILFKECRSLASAGYDTVLIAQHPKDEVIEGVRVIALEKPKSRLRRLFVTGPLLLAKAIREAGDAYHFHDPEILWVGAILRAFGKPVVFDMHENVPEQIRTKHWIPTNFRMPLVVAVKCLERIFLPSMHVIFAETSYKGDYLWHKRNEIVLNMPSSAAIPMRAARKSGEFSVGYIGRLHEDRGALTMLKALALLKGEGVNVECNIVGTGDKNLLESMRILARDNGLSIALHGYLSSADGLARISSSSIGLALLKPLPNYLRSYPTKVFEYMALGLPVITSDFPLYRSIIEKHSCGICVDPEKPIEIAKAIRRLSVDNELRARMGQNGISAIRDFYNWDNEALKLIAYYQSNILVLD